MEEAIFTVLHSSSLHGIKNKMSEQAKAHLFMADVPFYKYINIERGEKI